MLNQFLITAFYSIQDVLEAHGIYVGIKVYLLYLHYIETNRVARKQRQYASNSLNPLNTLYRAEA